jgi:hypothetical protein
LINREDDDDEDEDEDEYEGVSAIGVAYVER